MKFYNKILLRGGKILPFNKLRQICLNQLAKREGGWAFSSSIREFYKQKYNIEIGYGTYGGCFNISNIPSGVIFGNYCSVADGVKIFRANHPMQFFTTHPIFYNPVMGYVKKDTLHRPKLEVGNDVWIGANALILPGCHKIGNGAVIGAGSVVTKDVPPYSIVVGNPAKVIKMRFNPAQIDYLENIKWWDKMISDLIPLKDSIQNNLNDIE